MPYPSTIQRRHLVEFTDAPQQHYTLGDPDLARYGVAVDAEHPDHSVQVQIADGTLVTARYIHAFAWAGWMPESLESVYAAIHGDSGAWEE